MMLDFALRDYTDKINANESIDITYFQNGLSKEEFIEFSELIPFIGMVKATKLTDSFQKIFTKVNEHKESIYRLSSVSSFRVEHDSNNEEAVDELNRIFNEEFGDG